MKLDTFRRLDQHDRRIRQLERVEPEAGGGGGGGDHPDSDHTTFAPLEHDTAHDDRFALIVHTHPVHADSDHDDRFSLLAHVHAVAWADIAGKPATFPPTPEMLTVEDLADVDYLAAAPADGYVLVYNDADNLWRPASLTGEGSGVFHPYLGDDTLELSASTVMAGQMTADAVYVDGSGGGTPLVQVGDHTVHLEPRVDLRRWRANDARISISDTSDPGADYAATVNVQAGSLRLNGTRVALAAGAWQAMSPLTSPWVAGANAPRYRLEGDVVRLDGIVTRPSGSTSTFFTLPSTFRPVAQHSYAVTATLAFGRLVVVANGNLNFTHGTGTGEVNLDGVTFPTT